MGNFSFSVKDAKKGGVLQKIIRLLERVFLVQINDETFSDLLQRSEILRIHKIEMPYIAHDDFLRSNVGVATTFYERSLWASFIYFQVLYLLLQCIRKKGERK